MRATQSSATSFTQARLFTKFVAILYDGISLQVLTFCFRKSPLLLVVLKNFMNFATDTNFPEDTLAEVISDMIYFFGQVQLYLQRKDDVRTDRVLPALG